jgi:DNA-binding beta-propeller fold protein YncE
VQVYAVPSARIEPGRREAEPTQTITGDAAAPIRTPGSLASFALGPDTTELLVCHNYSNVVTRHVLDRRRGYASVRDEVLLRRGLDVPDGICISADGALIAVSNHNTHEVLLYRRTAGLGPDAAPDAVLRNVICPHGVRFTGDRQHVLVADAHARYVNVYERGAAGWHGVLDPCRMAPVLDRAT